MYVIGEMFLYSAAHWFARTIYVKGDKVTKSDGTFGEWVAIVAEGQTWNDV